MTPIIRLRLNETAQRVGKPWGVLCFLICWLGMALEQRLRAYILIHKQNPEKANWEQPFEISKPTPPMTHVLRQGHIS